MDRSGVPRQILEQEGFHPEESSGLFVGISTFDVDKSFAPVAFAVDDAVDLAWVFSCELGLIEKSRCVLALAGEPQNEESRQRLAELIAGGAKTEYPGAPEVIQQARELGQSGGPRGLFVLSISSHGLTQKSDDVLLAADSRRARLPGSGIRVAELSELAATAQARRRLFILDACRERVTEGTRSVAGPPMSRSFASALVKAKGYTVLMGSVAGGYSYDDPKTQNGVFTGALVKGLLGAAKPDERGFITVETLAEYAQQQVQTWVSRHRRGHRKKSLGIEKRFDESAQYLPLAISRPAVDRPDDDDRTRDHPDPPRWPIILRFVLGVAGVGVAATIGMAPFLGKFQIPGFDALLQLFPRELQKVLLPLSALPWPQSRPPSSSRVKARWRFYEGGSAGPSFSSAASSWLW